LASFSSGRTVGQGVLNMTKDMTAGVASVVVGVGYLISAFRIPVFATGDEIGPRLFPFMISAVVILCGAVLVLRELLNKDRKPFAWGFAADRDIWLRILFTIAAGVLYGLILDWLGYVIATFFFMSFVASIINVGKYRQNAFLAAAFSVSTYVAFAVILKLSLPRGILGGILPF
jgi:putative tricarboxylic transport membrane protein